MTEEAGEAIGWTVEAQGGKTVVAQHADGHRIVFAFAPEQRIGPVVRSVRWATEGDHDGDYLDALRMALGIAKASGWSVVAGAGTITSGG